MMRPAGQWAYVALGSNLGERTEHLRAARDALAALPSTRLVAASSVEETPPLDGSDQPAYLNQMVLLETTLEPRALLDACLTIERSRGRVRAHRWGPRTLDLDVVRFGDREVNEPGLIVPHPALPHRDFWQRELIELAPYEREVL